MTTTATVERVRTESRAGMRRKNRAEGPSKGLLAVIGAVASVVLLVAGGLLVASGSGSLSRDPQVTATVPAEAGLIQGAAGVQYQGVHVGSVVGIDAGVTSSRLTMQLGKDKIVEIPASVMVRIVPRTLFGDVFIELVPPENPEIGPRLSGGAEVAVDTSDEAVQLANLYYRAADLLEQLRPEQLATALDAVSQALEGRGESLGATIDRMAALTADLGPLVDAGIAAAPQMAAVAESMSAATDDVITVMQNASELSRIALANEDGIARLLSGGAVLGAQGADVLSANTDNMIAVVRNGAPVVGAFAGNTEGLDETFEYLGIFGEAGARVFSTGRFNITAIADFADPMPYTSADCPRYPGMEGSNCGDPVQTSATGRGQVVSAAEESEPLGFLEQISAGVDPADPAALLRDPSTAASVLLGPLVRGTAVSVP
ncbi:MCE family protein [Rhodococcus sp. NPDC060090]|uniref:MCE family protein n=1 Tax=Rhodococcus sp. NPDC060090 TaxID=3347056 RepID=UPI003657B5AD